MEYVRTGPDPVNATGASFGNAILSKWPLTKLASVELPSAAGAFAPRTVVAAHVDTPTGRWPVAATHFDYLFDASATRQLQAERLLELALEWRGDPASDPPLIVGADLNAVADSAEVQLLTGRRPGVGGIVFSDVWEQVGDGPGVTWRSDNPHIEDSTWPNRRLDYLLVSWPRPKPVGNPISAWLVGRGNGADTWASDHLAVVADLVTPDRGITVA
jgi:endonuclease/exonuclease/phosphatase family metal-dependent hydrolase